MKTKQTIALLQRNPSSLLPQRQIHSPIQFVAVLIVITMSALGVRTASAQEDVIGPPPPLQWPTAASPHTNGEIPFQLNADGGGGLRQAIEEAADVELCKMLMKDAQMPIPNEATFKYADCPSSIKAKIDAREGKFAWEQGARPTECGRNCIGPPFMSQTQNVDRPNARFAMVYGNFTFHVDTLGPFNRDVYYGLEVDVTCDVPAGTSAGIAKVVSRVDGPTAEDPGLLESIFNYLVLPLEFSQRVTDTINSGYGVSTNPGPTPGPCSSIGAFAAAPADFKFDSFVWDLPKPPGHPTVPDAPVIKPTTTLYFDRIIRNKTIESNASTAPLTFTVYINGVPAHIPRNGAISLAPNGRHEQKYCKTITMDGIEALQILFVDSLGGAVWSQFTPPQNFGSGGTHKMTTGRTILRPALHPGDKPQSFLLREFELDYRVDYHAAPTSTGPAKPPLTPGRRPSVPPVFAPPDRPQPDSTCIKI